MTNEELLTVQEAMSSLDEEYPRTVVRMLGDGQIGTIGANGFVSFDAVMLAKKLTHCEHYIEILAPIIAAETACKGRGSAAVENGDGG